MSSGPEGHLRPFSNRPDICQHLFSFVYRFNCPLASAAGPYILQYYEFPLWPAARRMPPHSREWRRLP